MKNIPLALVQTWLSIAKQQDPELLTAKNKAVNNLLKAFGNLDVAEIYLKYHNKRTK